MRRRRKTAVAAARRHLIAMDFQSEVTGYLYGRSCIATELAESLCKAWVVTF